MYHGSELNIFLWEDDDAGNLVLFQDKKNIVQREKKDCACLMS